MGMTISTKGRKAVYMLLLALHGQKVYLSEAGKSLAVKITDFYDETGEVEFNCNRLVSIASIKKIRVGISGFGSPHFPTLYL